MSLSAKHSVGRCGRAPERATGTPRALATSDWIGPGLRELRRLNGNGTTLTFLDGESAASGYDAVQRITRLRVLGPDGVSALVDREHSYNRASMRTAEVRHDDFGLTDSYTYDSLYRITHTALDQGGLPGAIGRAEVSIGYQLDGVGNRRQVDTVRAAPGGGTETLSASYSVDALNQSPGAGVTHSG